MIVPRSFRVLRHRDFALVQVGNAVSNLGTWMQYVGLGWATRELTDSTLVLGLAFASQFTPFLFVTPIAGVVADRYDRRRVVLAMNLFMAVPPIVIGLMVARGTITVAWLLVLSLILGTANAMAAPASQAVVPALVPAAELPQAVGFQTTAMNLARIAGPSVGGVAIGAWGLDWAFYLNGLSFLAVVVAWAAVRPEGTRATGVAAEPFLSSLRRGAAYARSETVIRRLVMLSGVLALFPYHAALMPVIARDVLDGGVSAYGMLSSATGFGAVVGAFIATEINTDRQRRLTITNGAMAAGLAIVALSFSRNLTLSVCCLAVFGLGFFSFMAPSTTVIMMMTPDGYRGRVLGLFTMVNTGGVPIAAVTGGLLSAWLGPTTTVLIGGTAMASFAIWFAASRSLRLLGAPSPPGEADQPLSGVSPSTS